MKETWKFEDTPEPDWDSYQTFPSGSSTDSIEPHHIVLSPNRTTYEPVFEPGANTAGQNATLPYSPGTPLSSVQFVDLSSYSRRRFTFSGLRTASTDDIRRAVSDFLFPGRSHSLDLNTPGVYSEITRDLIERPIPRRQLCLEWCPENSEMPPEEVSIKDQVRAHRLMVREAVTAFIEFKEFDFTFVPESYVKSVYDTCNKYKKTLLEGGAILEDSDNDYKPPFKDEVGAALLGYIKCIAACQKKIFEIQTERAAAEAAAAAERDAWERTAAQVTRERDERQKAAADQACAAATRAAETAGPTSARQFKANKVDAYETETLANITAITGEFAALMQTRPTTEKDAKLAEERLATLMKRSDTAVKEGRSLASDAAEADKLTSAEGLERQVRTLNTARDEAISMLSEAKVDLGVVGSGGHVRVEDLVPPTFTGDLELTDYYTWAKDLEEYFEAKSFSKAQQVSIVKKSCLKGVPATACLELATMEEIHKFLKSYYGNAGLMLEAKIRDFRKLGKCGGTAQKRRDWIIRAKQKLETLHKLAVDHEIQYNLYYSSLITEVLSSLTHDSQKKFREQMDILGVSPFDKAEMFRQTIDFLGELEQKTNFQMNFEITMGTGKVEEKQSSKPSGTIPKKTHQMDPIELSSDSDSGSITSIEHCTPAFIQANYTPPQERSCNACKQKHEYLFYCEKFQATRVRDRFRLTRAARVCMRCLRLDSRVDFNDRQGWFKEHDKDCQTEWACVADECAKKDKDKQFHFLMCSRHISANKERIAAFTKKVDKSLVKPTTKFLFHAPRVYNIDQVALPAIGRHPEGTDVADDITSPAIFLMQNYKTKDGKNLQIMFDSGCSAAALTERASKALETETLRTGPTEMGVAGGRTILIQGGDERFWLEATTPGKLLSITGLCMPEITTPFPVYPLTAAFEDLQRNYMAEHPQGRPLPLTPRQIGGSSVDIMMGIRYVKYFPKLLYSLNCGLGIYEAQFKTPNGLLGVLGGPHKSWLEVFKTSQIMTPVIFLTQEMKAYRQECMNLRHCIKDFQHLDDNDEIPVNLCEVATPADLMSKSAVLVEETRGPAGLMSKSADLVEETKGKVGALSSVPARNTCSVSDDQPADSVPESMFTFNRCEDFFCSNSHCKKHCIDDEWIVPSHWDITEQLYTMKGDLESFLELENCGTELSYRCIKCRNCVDCRKSDHLEKSSLQDEKQQALLESCVNLDVDSKTIVATLPLIMDPVENLKPNKSLATKMLDSQLRRLVKKPELIPDVLKAHNKLRDKGYVMPIKDLPSRPGAPWPSATGTATTSPGQP